MTMSESKPIEGFRTHEPFLRGYIGNQLPKSFATFLIPKMFCSHRSNSQEKYFPFWWRATCSCNCLRFGLARLYNPRHHGGPM